MFDLLGWKRIYTSCIEYTYTVYIYPRHIVVSVFKTKHNSRFSKNDWDCKWPPNITVTVKARLLLLLHPPPPPLQPKETTKFKTQVTVPNHRQGVSITESIQFIDQTVYRLVLYHSKWYKLSSGFFKLGFDDFFNVSAFSNKPNM